MVRRFVKRVINTILVLVVLVAIFGLLLPSLFSTQLAIVYSGSMEPVMPMGSLASMSPVEPSGIEVGDIIAFKHPCKPELTISHRVIEIIDSEPPSFQTKGDAVKDADPYTVPAENIIGRVTWYIPNIGFALDKIGSFGRSWWGFGLLICLPAIIIFGNTISDVNLTYSSAKRRARLRRKRLQLLEKRWGEDRVKRVVRVNSGILTLLK